MHKLTSAFGFAMLALLTACAGNQAAGSNSFLPRSSAPSIGSIGPDSTSSLLEFPFASSGLTFLTPDLRGNVWFGAADPLALVRIDEHTEQFTEFALSKNFGGPSSLALSPQHDTMWFTDPSSSSIGSIDLSNHTIERFKIHTANPYPVGIAAGPDNAMWFTEYHAGKIGRIGIANHAITEYSLPSPSGPYRIAQGPDGAMWFSNLHSIGRINTNGHVHLYSIGSNSATGITPGPDGGVWFTGESGHNGSLVGRIDPSTHTRKLFAYAAGSEGNEDLVFRGSSIYMTRLNGKRIDRFDLGGHVIHSRPLPHGYKRPWGITLGSDNQLWFTNEGPTSTAIGKLCPELSSGACKGS